MTFSFIEIEERKSKVIIFFFLALIFFYFFTAWICAAATRLYFYLTDTHNYYSGQKFSYIPSSRTSFFIFALAFLFGLIHWLFSTQNLLAKITSAIGALPLDKSDRYHQRLANVVDEVSVAVGGRKIEPLVINSAALNAFAVADFQGASCIGVTEGLLARLRRRQLEAVVAHEAAHIASGDSLTTSISCALFGVYAALLSGLTKLRDEPDNYRGKGGAYLTFITLVLWLMNYLGRLLEMFISRQKEYRADAVAVRLTRDPLALAEALMIISRNWRGVGLGVENMEAIFIVNPEYRMLDEKEGLLSDLFSTHPPIKKRINMLLDMGHARAEEIEKEITKQTTVPETVTKETMIKDTERWFVNKDNVWQGPFGLSQLSQLPWFSAQSWVYRQANKEIKPAIDDSSLFCLFKSKEGTSGFKCPHCQKILEQVNYEGVQIYHCHFCGGSLLERGKIKKILVRKEKTFSEEVMRQAEFIEKSKIKAYYTLGQIKNNKDLADALNCPKCNLKMKRLCYNLNYPVLIDSCIFCDMIWFDQNELELLQYLVEKETAS